MNTSRAVNTWCRGFERMLRWCGLCVTPSAASHGHPTLAAWLRALSYCLARSRFSVLVLLGGLVLLLTDQGRDVLIAYGQDGKTVRVALAAGFWALSIWGWCRLLLDIRFADPPGCTRCYNFWRCWLPRGLGSLAFVVLVLSAFQAGQSALGWTALLALVLFLVFVIGRRPATRLVTGHMARSGHERVRVMGQRMAPTTIGPESLPPYANLREALGIPDAQHCVQGERPRFRFWLVLGMFLTFLLLAALATFAPVWLGSRSGALILFFVWAGTWLPFGSWMSYVADSRGWPLLTTLAILALVSSCYNDNHAIREAPRPVAVDSRPTVGEALTRWYTANRPAPGSAGDAAQPFVVVATAGGGIRAAYWTGTLLGAVQDSVPAFARRTFAISGVSGGSVGATVYRALLDVEPGRFARECPGGYRKCTQRVLGHDFLGPLTAALLYPDMAQRFVPWAIFPDRAAALEKSWETAFRDELGEDGLNVSLAGLATRPWRAPALFLNATWVDNGRRIVASNLSYATYGEEAAAFVLANDELAELGYDLRLSTAAHNSARFPFVSPPGMWRHEGKIAGRLQDGGLFENYGAETAQEILAFACRRFSCGQKHDGSGRPRIRPVVILITSDPRLPDDLAKSPTLKPLHFGYEVRSTFRTYERVRSGRGAEAATSLQNWTREHGGAFFSFRMCADNAGEAEPPLGWALSEEARQTIDGYLPTYRPDLPPCYRDNAAHAMKLEQLLGS